MSNIIHLVRPQSPVDAGTTMIGTDQRPDRDRVAAVSRPPDLTQRVKASTAIAACTLNWSLARLREAIEPIEDETLKERLEAQIDTIEAALHEVANHLGQIGEKA